MSADRYLVDPADLLDEQGATELLGLAYRNGGRSITEQYPLLPAPLADFGPGRPRIWSRAELAAWVEDGGLERDAPRVKVTRYVDGVLCVVLEPLSDESRREVVRAINAAPKQARKPRRHLLDFLMAGVDLPAVSPGLRRRNEDERRAIAGPKIVPVLLPLDGSGSSDTMTKTVYRYIGDYLIKNPQVCARWPGLRDWWTASLMAHTDDGPVLWGVAEGGLSD